MTSLRWLIVFSLAAVAVADEGATDRRFLVGLRQRGLFRLAEKYCLDRLDRPDLPEPRRAELVIELSRSLAERAVSSPPGERPPLWQRAAEVTENFAQTHPQSPRLLLVRLQGALNLLSRGELARQEAALTAGGQTLLDEARTHLRTAVGQLRSLADEVQRQLPRQEFAPREETGQLSAHQLASIQKNVQYELARALRNQGQCYPSDSPDRANSLTQAVKLLAPLARIDLSHPLSWKSRIDLIVCHRQLADYETARRMLDAVVKQEPPPAVELRARAERIRLALAADSLGEAVAMLLAGRQIDAATSPELDYAYLQTYLAAWCAADDAKDQAKAAQWQAKAADMVRLIESLHGPYWSRRAEMLLAGYVRAAPDSGDLAMLVRAAESSFRSGELDGALDAYDRARALATKQGHTDRAFELGYVAATIEHRRGRHDQALQRYRQLALAMPDRRKAPEAHLLAIHHAAQIARRQSSGSLDHYAALLKEHVQTWPHGPHIDKVRRRLGKLHEHQQDWPGATAAYRAISPGDPQYLETVEAAGRCYRAWLNGRKLAGQPTQRIAAEAAEYFESLVLGPKRRLPERWTPVQRLAALEAAQLWLNYTPAGYGRAQNILSAAVDGAGDAPPGWKSAARTLLVFSLAGGGRRGEAGEVLGQISAGGTEQLLDMLEGLGRVASAAGEEVRRELAALQLDTIRLLEDRRGRLKPSELKTLDKVHAGALADSGRRESALAKYRSLAESYPRDGEIQEAFARLLLESEDRESLETALLKWRELEKRSPRGSQRWFRAKYSVAWLHYRLGNRQQAARIITLLRVLHPELGGPEMKTRFEQLLKRAEQQDRKP